MKTLLHAVALFFLLCNPFNSVSQVSEVSSVLSDLIGDSTIDLAESYDYDKSITIQLFNESDDSLRHALIYILRFSENGNFMVMIPEQASDSRGKSEMVIDFEKMRMITFLKTAGAKMAVVMPVESAQIADMNTLFHKFGTLSKTGEKKIILGHQAEEYRFNSDNESGTLWIGKDFDLNIKKSFSAIGLEILPPKIESKGNIVEVDFRNKSTGTHTKMSLLDVNMSDPYAIITEGYIPTRLPEAIGDDRKKQ